ncbi:hypothetical protein [Peribacillus butanolivorans]|uniref:hypothetical protein n=1 Tax=Peribacillus butanolivorans TaxID=421767 RepID=UPI0035DB98BA
MYEKGFYDKKCVCFKNSFGFCVSRIYLYLNDRFGMIPAALGGLILLIALSTLFFLRKENEKTVVIKNYRFFF